MRSVFYSILMMAFFCYGSSVADEVNLEDIDGKKVTFLKDNSANVSVFVFTTIDCPIANSLSPAIKRIYKEFEGAVEFVLVYVDKDLTEEKVKVHARDYGLSEIDHIVIDKQHKIIDLSKADITPQGAIFGKDHQLKYIGAINNLFSDYGDKKAKATQHYLRDNLKSILEGKEMPYPETKTYGCYIPKD